MKDVCRTGETNIDEDKIKELVGIPKFVYVNNIIKSIIKKDVDGAIKATYDVLDEGKDLENFLWEMIKHSKDILMCKVNRKLDLYNEDEQKQLKELAESVSKDELINIIYKLSELEGKMKMSSQKVIVFETEIIKLCTKMETASLEDRISKLEKAIQNGEIIEKTQIQINSNKVINSQAKAGVQMPSSNSFSEKKDITEPKKNETKVIPKAEPLAPGSKVSGWQNVMTNLKSQGKVMLYANLINTEVVELNDMTVAIRFNNGLTAFRKELLNKSENLNILNKEIAMLCGKPMQIKFEDASSGNSKASSSYNKKEESPVKQEILKPEDESSDNTTDDFLEDLDIEINFVDEE